MVPVLWLVEFPLGADGLVYMSKRNAWDDCAQSPRCASVFCLLLHFVEIREGTRRLLQCCKLEVRLASHNVCQWQVTHAILSETESGGELSRNGAMLSQFGDLRCLNLSHLSSSCLAGIL